MIQDMREIDTPAVVVDLQKAKRNIERYQQYCDEHKLKLRPHIKTHKLPLLTRMQLDAGASGITCQKVSEALAMLNARVSPIPDILITYNIIGEEKLEGLRKLQNAVKLSVTADNETVVEGLNCGFAQEEKPLRVLVECNTGADRCGVKTPEEALDLAKLIKDAAHLEFAGLMTYPPTGELQQTACWLSRASDLFEKEGLGIPMISSGGSPDMWRAHEVKEVNEVRVGTYVYFDRSLIERKTCEIDDCALIVHATVVSVTPDSHAIMDAGSKVLSSDLLGMQGYGLVVGRPDLTIDQLSEEHGRLRSGGPLNITVGEHLQIIPNHACVVTNLARYIYLQHPDGSLEQTEIPARGMVQ